MKNNKSSIFLQLGISAAVVIIAAFIYGADPSSLLPKFLGFEVENLELKNILRAIMGLYLAFAVYWVYALFNPKHQKSALITNILFMGGLAIGRTLSLLLDGVSNPYLGGMILEYLMMFWGIYNVRHIRE